MVDDPRLGLSASAEPLTPARFDVLVEQPGRYELRFTPRPATRAAAEDPSSAGDACGMVEVDRRAATARSPRRRRSTTPGRPDRRDPAAAPARRRPADPLAPPLPAAPPAAAAPAAGSSTSSASIPTATATPTSCC